MTNQTCKQCGNSLDESAFSWNKNGICNGCSEMNQPDEVGDFQGYVARKPNSVGEFLDEYQENIRQGKLAENLREENGRVVADKMTED